MSARRYDDACAAAHALDLIGDRWALLVVRELVLGPKRFTDLRTGLPGISPNILTQRLEELEEVAIVERRKLPPPAAVWVYELTPWGRELEPVIVQLGRWGARSPHHPSDASISPDGLAMSFRSMFSPAAAEGLAADYELRIGDDRFHAHVADGRFSIERGTAPTPDVVLTADTTTLATLAYGGLDISEAVSGGRLLGSGDKVAARRFFSLFPMPEPAPTRTPSAAPAAAKRRRAAAKKKARR